MTTLGNKHHRHPDWQVTAVFDPDGEGQDFAYTVGLDGRDLPELHIWGRPSLGDDPGADWKLSPKDCCVILNEVAWRLIDGTTNVGDTWEETYDGGMVTVRFRLDPPGDRDELEAFGIARGAQVLPLRWSLHRRPVGRPQPLSNAALKRATKEYAELKAGLPEDARHALQTKLLEGGEFGPLSAMAEGRIAQFRAADSITLTNLAEAAVTMSLAGGITWPVATAHAIARDLGRVDEAARTLDVAKDAVDARMGAADWPQVQREITQAIGFAPGEASDDEVMRGLRGHLTELLWTVLSAEVVADRLTAKQRLHGRGAWLTGLGPVGELPGPQWRAPRRVLERLYAVLAPLGPAQLLELVKRHLEDDTKYTQVANMTEGWAIVAPAGCPWRRGLERLPGVIWPGRVSALQQWATVMTSAACHRTRLSPDDVATLTAPFLDLVPDLSSFISAGRS